MNKTGLYKTRIKGTGSFLPKKVLTNFDLEKMVDTSNEWIIERTGINTRHIAAPEEGEAPSDMAVAAARSALENANMSPEEIDFVLIATFTPDYRLPNTASLVQLKLGISNECPCVDISAACSGFVYGAVMADSMIKTGLYKNVLVIGADSVTHHTNWDDRTTCVLFSDGAGAAIFSRNDSDEESNILSSTLSCDGTGAKFLKIPRGGVLSPVTPENVNDGKHEDLFIKMEGRQVFKYATRTMLRNAADVLKKAEMENSEVDWFIPHQANLRIIEYIAKNVNIDMDKVIVTVDKYGNNSAATIPIALDEAIRDGRIVRGHNVILDAFGAGVTSGALLLKY